MHRWFRGARSTVVVLAILIPVMTGCESGSSGPSITSSAGGAASMAVSIGGGSGARVAGGSNSSSGESLAGADLAMDGPSETDRAAGTMTENDASQERIDEPSTAEESSAGPGSISEGSITRIEGRATLQGAGENDNGGIRVESVGMPHAAVTTSTGRFSLTVEPGGHILKLSRDGYGVAQIEIPELSRGEVHRLDDVVVLAAQPGALISQVVLPGGFRDADVFATVTIALIDAQAQGSEPLRSVNADQQGNFSLSDISPGDYRLRVSADGFVTQTRAVTVTPGSRQSLPAFVLSLVESGALTAIEGIARLQGAEEGGHGGIRIESVGTPFAAVTTGAGRFRIAVIAGTHTLRFSYPGFGSSSVEVVNVLQGETRTMDAEVVLAGQPGELRGAVLFPPGLTSSEQRAQVSVELWGINDDPTAEDGSPIAFVPLDAQDRFRLVDVLPGEYLVRATGGGYRENLRPVFLEPGEILDLGDLVLTLPEPDVFRTTAIEGTVRLDGVLGETGHGGIRVESLGTPFATVTTSEGRFFLSVTPGEHRLQFSMAGYGIRTEPIPAVSQGETLTLSNDYLLTSNPGEVRGVVVLPAGFSGSILDAVIVELQPADPVDDPSRLGLPITDVNPDGTFILSGVNPGDYVVNVSALGFADARRYTQLSAGEVKQLGDVLLVVESGIDAEPARVRGVVERAGASSGEHGNIEIRALGTPFRAQSAPNGFFEIEVIPGSYTLEFTYPGYLAEQHIVADVGESEQRALDVTIVVPTEPALVTGSIRLAQYETPRRLGEVDITLLLPDGRAALSTVEPNSDGSFAIDNVNPGQFVLMVKGRGYTEKALELNVEPGTRLELDEIVLEHHSLTDDAVKLAGNVLLEGETNHEGVTVEVRSSISGDFELGSVMTDEHGNFEVNASADDTYTITVQSFTRDSLSFGDPAIAIEVGPLDYRADLEAFVDSDLRPMQVTLKLAGNANGDDDGDLILNGEDNCRNIGNHDQTDFDSDGIGDVCDNDVDGDGLLNLEEVNLWGTDPMNPDSDGDNLPDLLEARGLTQAMNADSDGDGIPDGVEMPDPRNPSDYDGDGEFDAIESAKHDTDGDGAFDQFDGPGPFGDLDGDGILNGERGPDGLCVEPGTCDLCPTVADFDQSDKDGDGRGDACDLFDDSEEAPAPPQCTVTPNLDTTVTILCEGEAPVVVGQPENEQGACYRCVGVDPFFARCAQVVVNSVGTRICTDGLNAGVSAGEALICKTRADCCQGAGRAFEGGTCGACLAQYTELVGGAAVNDGSAAACLPPDACGNGLIELGEACDDGNVSSGDGCNDQCLVEPEKGCLGEPSECVELLGAPNGYVRITPPISEDGEPLPFTMGSSDNALGRHDDETLHNVYLTHNFFMKQTEVTKAEWLSHFPAGSYTPPSELDCDDCPVVGLTFFNALAFANKVSSAQSPALPECYTLSECQGREGYSDYYCGEIEINSSSGSLYDCFGYRLPTEAEWVYSARGESSATLPGGEPLADDGDLVDLFRTMSRVDCASFAAAHLLGGGAYDGIFDCFANAAQNADHLPVKGGDDHPRQPNAFSLYDLMGGVSEWVWDRYEPFSTETVLDPDGSDTGLERVIKGGSYKTQRDHMRVAFRSFALPMATEAPAFHDGIGFRLARSEPGVSRGRPAPPDATPSGDATEADEFQCRPRRRYIKRVVADGESELLNDTSYGSLGNDDISINGVGIGRSEDDALSTAFSGADASSIAKARAINQSYSHTQVLATVGETRLVGDIPVGAVNLNDTDFIKINDVAVSGLAVLDNDAVPLDLNGQGPTLRDAINAQYDTTGVSASLTTDRRLALLAPDGRNIVLEVFSNADRLGFMEGVHQARGGLSLSSEKAIHLSSAGDNLALVGVAGGAKVARSTRLIDDDYLFCEKPATYDVAQTHCESLGGSLVGVDTLMENNWLWMSIKMRGQTQAWWVGHRYSSGVWVRSDGGVGGLVNFSEESADSPGECAALTSAKGEWSVAQCQSAYRFICAL